MVDPKVVLVLLACYGVVWGVGKGVEVTKAAGHAVKRGVVAVAHKVHRHHDQPPASRVI
jgi:hypothetical protein